MSDKVDFKKRDKEFYAPSAKTPSIVTLPPLPFLTISGRGNPNTSPEFAAAVSALYSLSYRIKMLPKKGETPEGYYEYTVPPLEGIWNLPGAIPEITQGKPCDSPWKDNLIWNLGIRQPEFVTPALVESLRPPVAKEKKEPAVERLIFETVEDGLCCQIMHIGPFDDEPATFARMLAWMETQGYRRRENSHREIYLRGTSKKQL